MKQIFYSGDFSEFKKYNLTEARQSICESYTYLNKKRVTVFISHKHDDLSDLQDIIGFLEKTYDVKCYIDSKDSAMPQKTSGTTASIIKQRIKQCDKFILLASNNAIESKWCNWELGFGDAEKYCYDDIAIFPFQERNEIYKGREYLEVYPQIAEYDGSERYIEGGYVDAGYYVCTTKNGIQHLTPLKDWLEA
ncbi:MAG: toll/interleukin-1 receptor domain-containing protein [Lachnospiraceae bacterium]|nr:toll/interleukin-1 receptor domain-containing protein [Lachnospiraceae bacterium]